MAAVFDAAFEDFELGLNSDDLSGETNEREGQLVVPHDELQGRFVEEDVHTFIVENKNPNTDRKTRSDVTLLTKYIQSVQKTSNDVKIEDIVHSELDGYISKFLVGIRKPDNTEYEPCSIKSMFNSFERYLRDHNYGYSLINSPEFHQTRQARISKCKNLKGQGKGSRPNATRSITDDEVNLLYEKGILGMSTPQSLLNTVWWNNSRHFGMRAQTEHHSMQFGDVKLLTFSDESKTDFLQYTERQTKTRQGSDPRDTRVIKPTMWATSGLPLDDRDPVSVFKRYSQLRPKNMMHGSSPFYLAVNYSLDSTKKHKSDPYDKTKVPKVWYKSQPLGVNSLGSIMRSMFNYAGVDNAASIGKVSNHSARKTMINQLKKNQVSNTEIIQVTGHKNVNSLNSYDAMDYERQHKFSNTLEKENTNQIVSKPTTMPVASTMVNNEVSSASNCFSVKSKPQQPMMFFPQSNITGGTFNITINTMNSPVARKRKNVIDSDSEE